MTEQDLKTKGMLALPKDMQSLFSAIASAV